MTEPGNPVGRSRRRQPPDACRRQAGLRRALARPTRVAGMLLLVAAALGGCATSREPAAAQRSPAAAAVRNLGQVAVLRAIGGSAVSGKVRVVDRGDGAMVTVAAFNLPIGEFRIAIQETPNCTSPNGFSAGPAWAPPASKRKPEDLVSTLIADADGNAQASQQVAGLRATGVDGVAGHSVVVYAGSRVTAAHPDVPNERIACGVFEPVKPLAF